MKATSRYVKLIIIALASAWLVFELIVNLEPLRYALELRIGFPWLPLGILAMPVWVALLSSFLLAFTLAVVLEIVAWYEYTRVIRLQRAQIQAFQERLGIAPISSSDPSPKP